MDTNGTNGENPKIPPKNSKFTSLKEYLDAQPRFKIVLWIALAILAPTLIFVITAYAFTFHGMLALYEWTKIAQFFVILIIIFGVLLPIFTILDVYLSKKQHFVGKSTKPIRIPSRAIWVMLFIGFFTPVTLYSWVQLSIHTSVGDTQPQLLMTDQTGNYGLPNLAVVYWTASPETHSITWGTFLENQTVTEEKTYQDHVFELNNLIPETTYYYQINQGPIHNFTTSGNVSNQIKFAVSSDCHIGAPMSSQESTERILTEISDPARGNDYFFMMGDFIEYGFDRKAWEDGIDIYSQWTSNMPTRNMIGNHGAMFAGADFYKDYFYPDRMPLNVDASPFYQRIDINNIHFLCLDLEWGTSETYFGAQQEWLLDQLQDIDAADWTIVMSHTFYYASGTYAGGTPWYDNPETIAELVPLFEEYDVDLVYSGHIHAMNFLTMNNVGYSVVGSFGGHLEPEPDTTSEATDHFYDQEHFGFLETEINGNMANLTFYDEYGAMLFTYEFLN